MPSLPAESTALTMGADLFLQGVLCAQFAHYTNVNQRDSVWMRLFVAGLALLTTLKTTQVLAMVSIQNAALFPNLQAVHQWLSQMNLILEAGIAFYVQIFFCHRLWALSHNIYIMVVAMSLFIFALIAASVAAYLFTSRSTAGLLIAVHLGLAMGGDLLQTGSIVFYLLRHSQAVLRKGPTASMLSSLLRLTIQARAFCALVDFVATILAIQLAPTTSGPSIPFAISVVANVMLPKLYAMAAMWTLNSRDKIRSAADVTEPSTHVDFPSFRGMGVGGTSYPEMPRYRHAGEIETTGSQSTYSINGSENIRPNCAEWKAWAV
ncbi:hypothetical protein C8F04DRAFT_1344270 [Mycena alexandri]|uniref:DUF6534 domain-containing protein n=1 Tax=Mycena alexandri TaxID=1745969 RepID=A0AAD6X582_9AGAR|nr:hypothetical protein C8F04DRAFT_1344270 [Mycena alexandri]